MYHYCLWIPFIYMSFLCYSQLVDGLNIRDINLVRLRNMISVVSQEPILFDCSIRDNIVYGLDNTKSMDDVIGAARASNIHEFITNLPQVGWCWLVDVSFSLFYGGWWWFFLQFSAS